MLVWITFSLDTKRPHLAVRHTYHLVEFCLFSGRDDKQHDIVFGFGRLFSVFTTMFFPVGWSLIFTVLFTVSFLLCCSKYALRLAATCLEKQQFFFSALCFK